MKTKLAVLAFVLSLSGAVWADGTAARRQLDLANQVQDKGVFYDQSRVAKADAPVVALTGQKADFYVQDKPAYPKKD